MDLRDGKLLGGIRSVPVLTLVFAKERAENRQLKERLFQALARTELRCLHVDGRGSARGLERRDPSFWDISASGLRENPLDDLDLAQIGVDLVLVDADAGIDEARLPLHGESQRTVVILTPDESEVLASYQIVKSLSRRAGVKKVDVLVAENAEKNDGPRVFARLYDVCCRFLDTELNYLGSVRLGEKNDDSGFRSEFLLDSKSGSVPVSDLLSIVKRLGFIPAQ